MRINRLLTVTLLTTGLVAALTAAPASAAPINRIKDASFENPKVSGEVPFPTGANIGPCANGAPYPGPDYHCWRVGSGTAYLVHNDFMIGGVKVKPKALTQFATLVGQTTPSGGYLPGELHQATKVPSNTNPILTFWYATMPTPGAMSAIHVVVQACTVSGLACVTRVDTVVSSTSTGNPAAMGWVAFRAPIPVNVDEGLVKVSVASAPIAGVPINGDPAIDAFSLK